MRNERKMGDGPLKRFRRHVPKTGYLKANK